MITWLNDDYPMAEISDTARATVIKEFTEHGKTVHSEYAGTLRMVLEHCEQKKIPYILHANPGSGYLVERAVK